MCRPAHHQPSSASCDQAALLDSADAQRDVHTFRDEIHDAIIQPQVEFDGRVALRELVQADQFQKSARPALAL